MTQLLTAVWAPDPVLFTLGPLRVHWYGVLFALAFSLGFLFVRGVFLREGRPEADLERLLISTMVGTVVGARLGEALFYNPAYYLSNPLEIAKVWKGGLSSHGGALGIFTALWLYAHRRPDQPYLCVLDLPPARREHRRDLEEPLEHAGLVVQREGLPGRQGRGLGEGTSPSVVAAYAGGASSLHQAPPDG